MALQTRVSRISSHLIDLHSDAGPMTTAVAAGAAGAAAKEQPAPAKLLQELLDEYKKVNKKADKPVPTGIKPRGTCGRFVP